MSFRSIILFLLLSVSWASAQDADSLEGKTNDILHGANQTTTFLTISSETGKDTLSQKLQTLGSISSATHRELSGYKSNYDSVLSEAEHASNKIQRRIDSLQNLSLPTVGLHSKLDSIAQWKQDKIGPIQNKVDSCKNRIRKKIDQLNLPPEIEGKVSGLTSTLNQFNLKTPLQKWTNKLNLNMGELNLSKIRLPETDNLSISQIKGLDLSATDLGNIQNQIPSDQSLLSKMGEETLMNLGGDVTGEIAGAGQLSGSMQLVSEAAAKQQLKQTAQKATNQFFEGKQEQLKEAMGKMVEYKKEYDGIQGVVGLAKKRISPIKRKSFRERLLPGVMLQVQQSASWWLDVNPYVGYRFTRDLILGVGWNQRIAFDFDDQSFANKDRIYGPRGYVGYSLGRGFNGHLDFEYMNTLVPPPFAVNPTDKYERDWVFSAMAGLKKEYTFLRKVKGTLYLLYNLYDPNHISPYRDKLNMRLGFEFPQKKNLRKK